MYVYIHIYIYIYVCIYIYIYMYLSLSIYIYIYIYICVCMYNNGEGPLNNGPHPQGPCATLGAKDCTREAWVLCPAWSFVFRAQGAHDSTPWAADDEVARSRKGRPPHQHRRTHHTQEVLRLSLANMDPSTRCGRVSRTMRNLTPRRRGVTALPTHPAASGHGWA